MSDVAAPHDQGILDRRNVGDWERIASGLGGAALIGYAIARPGRAGAAMAAGGAVLLQRAITGACPLYAVLGVNTREGMLHAADDGAADAIEQASEDSFPASDPPSWTPQRVGNPNDRT